MRLTVEEKKQRLFEYGYQILTSRREGYGKGWRVGNAVSRIRSVEKTPMRDLRANLRVELKK